jgi:NADH dehydrogenase
MARSPERFYLELEPPAEELRDKPHVVIVGGGFAGVKACKSFKGADVRVTLIDKRNFNLFQPLLYQVATGLVGAGDVATPLRLLVGAQRNVQVLLGEVSEIQPDAREIIFNGKSLSYDHLILAAGSGSTYFGHEDWRGIAPPMKILEHAAEIRRRLLMALEQAEQTSDSRERVFLQTVVIVGGGPAGCELAGAVAELMRNAMAKDFKQVDTKATRIVLVDPGDRVLRAMDPELSEAAGEHLRSVGVEMLFHGRVQSIVPGEVLIGTPDGDVRIRAANVFWTAGVRASHLGRKLADATGCEVDRGGRVVVGADFSIPNHPEIRVVGDLCSYSHTADGKPLPGMAGPATQMGGWVAKDIRAKLEGGSQAPFRFFDFGTMAVLGRISAVADLRGIKFTGVPGWALWAAAHLAFMPDEENRISLLIKWLVAILSQQRSGLLVTGMPNQDVGLEGSAAPFPMGGANEPSIAAMGGTMAKAMENFREGNPEPESQPAQTAG